MNQPGRRRRKDARPAEILDAARQEFVDNGFSATRVEDIAKRAGSSKGLVYAYYPTKVALFEAVIRANVVPVLEGAANTIANDDKVSAGDQLRMLITLIHTQLADVEKRRLFHLIIAEGPRFPEIARFYHAEVVTPGRALIRNILARGVARGEFRDGRLGNHPEIVIAPMLIAMLWRMMFESYEPMDVESFTAAHIETMLRALSV